MSNPQLANDYKNKGNDAFKAQRYEEAIDWFTKAIDLNPADQVFYSNRSGAYLNFGQH
jgi:stress-induced-phosphoprotein 1